MYTLGLQIGVIASIIPLLVWHIVTLVNLDLYYHFPWQQHLANISAGLNVFHLLSHILRYTIFLSIDEDYIEGFICASENTYEDAAIYGCDTQDLLEKRLETVEGSWVGS